MSKLADLMFSLELQERLVTIGSAIESICAHPGYSLTNIKNNATPSQKFFDALSQPFLAQSAAQGALPILYAAVEPSAQAGAFYGPSGILETKGYPGPAKIPARAKDRTIAQQLWSKTQDLTRVSFPAVLQAGIG